MKSLIIKLFIILCWVLTFSQFIYTRIGLKNKVNRTLYETNYTELDPKVVKKIDTRAKVVLQQYQHLNIAVVLKGKIVLTKTYGGGYLNTNYAYASVSKPVTSMIIMQLVSKGQIKSIDDNIWEYSTQYKNCIPARYGKASLTIRQLLNHTSGIPHIQESTWEKGKLNLKFKPGTDYKYSTPGYGVLGDIIESVTGKTYEEAVKIYIGLPVGASSFSAGKHFWSPGAFVSSTIKDMALFSIGVMTELYIKDVFLYHQVFKPYMRNYGLGWSCENINSKDLIASHSGSNGAPKAYLFIKPREKKGFCLLATQKTFGSGNNLREFVKFLRLIIDELK